MAETIKNLMGEKIQIKEDSCERYVSLEMISHIVQVKEVSLIYTLDGKAHISPQTIAPFESELKAYGFEKANHSTLVSIGQINDIYNRIITLKNGVKIKMARRKKYKF